MEMFRLRSLDAFKYAFPMILFSRLTRLFSFLLLCILTFSTINCQQRNVTRHRSTGSEGKSGQVDYVCSQCGHGILDIENVVFVPTRQASSTHNVSVPGIERPLILQHFVNPQHAHFDLVSATSADVLGFGKFFLEHTWWPGYRWQIALCPHCNRHVGWIFELAVTDEGLIPFFFGLIYENLVHNATTDGVFMSPQNVYM